MAKGNLFQGTAAGSVGDVVFYRRNGAQVSRARVRQINNPQSYNQATQRSYLSPLAKFFSPLASVLETSFEGKTRAESYQQYLKEGIKRMRNLSYSINKDQGFVPIPVKVSSGTMPSINAEAAEGSLLILDDVQAAAEGAITLGALSQAMIAFGAQDGDQLTIILVSADTAQPSTETTYTPLYRRIFLDSTSMEVIANQDGIALRQEENAILADATSGGGIVVAGVCILSRFENKSWRRSTESVSVEMPTYNFYTSNAQQEAARASYRPSSTKPVSDVYLNGATLAPADGARVLELNTAAGASVKLVGTQIVEEGDVNFLKGIDVDGTQYFLVTNSQRSSAFGKALKSSGNDENGFAAVPEGTANESKVIYADDENSPYTNTELWQERANWLYVNGVSINQLSYS